MKTITVSFSVPAFENPSNKRELHQFSNAGELESFLRDAMSVTEITYLSETVSETDENGLTSSETTVYEDSFDDAVLPDCGLDEARFLVTFSGENKPSQEDVRFAVSRFGPVTVDHVADCLGPLDAEPLDQFGTVILEEKPIVDWMVAEGECEDPAILAKSYDAKVISCTNSFDIEITEKSKPEEDRFSLGLTVEINGGLPCVHVTNDVGGNIAFTIFSHKDGLYIRGDESNMQGSLFEVSDSFDLIRKNHSGRENSHKDVVFVTPKLA